jgi:drug/metabolite transporter (DMT)-like permease
MAARSRAAILLVLCAVLWSTGGLLITWIAWPALAVAGMRSAIAALVLLCVLREWRPRWSWWLGSGALAGAASMLGFVVATKLTTAANAIFLVYTAPLYVALLSPWVLHEPIRRGDWLTLLLAMLGLGRGVLTEARRDIPAVHADACQCPGGRRGGPMDVCGHA